MFEQNGYLSEEKLYHFKYVYDIENCQFNLEKILFSYFLVKSELINESMFEHQMSESGLWLYFLDYLFLVSFHNLQ